MGFFKPEEKKHTSLSDILKGLQQAVNSAMSALRAQQLSMLNEYIAEDGTPMTKTVQFGSKRVEVPVMSLLSHSNIEMDDVEIDFNAKISDIDEMGRNGLLQTTRGAEIPASDLMLNMSGVKCDAEDTIHIKIHFKASPVPEGVARINDEYNKLI